MNASLVSILCCPLDKTVLDVEGNELICRHGHRFQVVDGIPILLVPDEDPTHPNCVETLELVKLGHLANDGGEAGGVDSFVQREIINTNGYLYSDLIGKLTRYPIPNIKLPPGAGRRLLDVGCNWGRWVFAAARIGYLPVGIDPSIEAALAGRRIARQLGLKVDFVVADARRLPFAAGSFDVSYSYSVLQHFSKSNVRAALSEIARVTRRNGKVLVQMPNLLGLRQAFNRMRQIAFRDRDGFRVRYWFPWELKHTFSELIGPSRVYVDGFFTLNAQTADIDLLPSKEAAIVKISERLRKISDRLALLRLIADSLYVESVKMEP